MLQANFHRVQPAEHTCRNSSDSLSWSSFKHCSIFQPLEQTLPSPSDGWHACSRRCQLALDLTVRGTGYTHPPLHSPGDCYVGGVPCFYVPSMLLSRKHFFSEFATFSLAFADRRATAQTTTFVEPCSIQIKKEVLASETAADWSSLCWAMSWAHRGRLSLPLKNRNSASGQYGRVEASGKRRDESTVSWVGEANEASIGGLMVWWGWGGGELKCIAKGRCTAVAGGVKCEVREAMILRIAFRRGRQGKPKSPGDFAIDIEKELSSKTLELRWFCHHVKTM